MIIREPVSPEEFQRYYQLRWEILRKPWDQAPGSEKDDQENSSFHAMAVDESNAIVGVVRLQKNSETEGQVRFMAVRNDQQGKGIGKLLMAFIEDQAKKQQLSSITLQARENAVAFYKSIGYSEKEKTFRLWDIIQHYRMEKNL